MEELGSRVGLTGVTEVIMGDGGSAATGDSATMLMVRDMWVANMGERASLR